MQEAIAHLVQPVFDQGLALRERLLRAEKLSVEAERAHLKALLLTDVEARRWPDYGADEAFLGIRYALTCWLDELLVRHSPWADEWNARPLEADLYGTRDRAWRFWEQARLAENRAGASALEVFYLCIALGFRGALVDSPDELQQWMAAARSCLTSDQRGWPAPPELEPATFVPPLRGRDRLQRLALACGLVFALLIPLFTFLLMRHLED